MNNELPAQATYNVSNSEAIAFISCKRMWEFAFGLNLTPKETATPLARGSLGHLAFEKYVEARLTGDSHESSLQAGLAVFPAALMDMRPEVVMETQMLWERYMKFHQGWPEWTLLGTEQRVDLQLTDTLAVPIRYDLLIQEKNTGKIRIVDYKFTYDFWWDDDHNLNPQMPKYIGVMRANGQEIDGGYLEEIRTRSIKDFEPNKLWRRTRYDPSPKKIERMLRQHVAIALAIEDYKKSGTPEQRLVNSIPVLNKHGICKNCSFKVPCDTLNNGVTDLSVQLRTDFIDNTYGYNKQVFLDEI